MKRQMRGEKQPLLQEGFCRQGKDKQNRVMSSPKNF
jgi:hypothetical protein